MRDGNKIINNIDWPLFSVYMILMILGLTTVYSVAYNPEAPNLFDFSQKYGKQVVWLLVSLFLGLLVLLIDANIYTKFATPIYLFTLVLLVIVLFMPAKFGARAWLGIGSLGIQPAEFAKIGTALLLAKYISTPPKTEVGYLAGLIDKEKEYIDHPTLRSQLADSKYQNATILEIFKSYIKHYKLYEQFPKIGTKMIEYELLPLEHIFSM